jgi:Pectobacterium phage endonuclease
MLNPKVIAKFWANTEKTETCWLWKGKLQGKMPHIQIGSPNNETYEQHSARRVALELVGRPPKPGQVVVSACHNTNCVNPDHHIFGDEARFWNYVNKTDTCWLWTGATEHARGHGRFSALLNGKMKHYGAHRYAYELQYGPIPEGMVVRHACDVPNCVFYGHLSLGTPDDNVQDMVKRGRQARGETSGKTVLTEEDVKEIKRTCNLLQFAEEYGVGPHTIYNALTGKWWQHVK